MTMRPLSSLLLSLLLGTTAIQATDPVLVEFTIDLGGGAALETFQVEVYPDWAPLGAARFLELVDASFFESMMFFRVLDDFIAQFGIAGDPNVSAAWKDQTILDDPVVESNTKGTLSFAMRGPDTRTTQIFINLSDNPHLDSSGFAPFAQVVSGYEVVEKLYGGYGEGAPDGNGPDQFQIQMEGNAYLEAEFPLLTEIASVQRVMPSSTSVTIEATPASEQQGTTPSAEEEKQEEKPAQDLYQSSSGVPNFLRGTGKVAMWWLVVAAAILL